MSSAEAVGVGDFIVEDGAALASMVSSLRTSSFSSSESLRMITLPSSGGPRTPRLRSSKSLLVNSSSREVSRMRPSSSKDEEISTTGTFSEGAPCSSTGKQGRHEEISNGDLGGGGDLDDAGGGVEPPLGDEELSLQGERECLVPLLSSIMAKRRREENSKRESKGMRDGYQRKMKEIFISVKRCSATVMGIVSIPARPLAHVALKIMHHAPVI
jgi:hypothetical protein